LTLGFCSLLVAFYIHTSLLIATLAGFPPGIPPAYFLARHDFPGKKLIEGLIDVPIVVPHTAAGIALLFVFGRSFAVN
jgi:molybdate/tungstate transport system permease protein